MKATRVKKKDTALERFIECNRLVTLKLFFGRGKNKTEDIYKYRVLSIFDKFQNKW